LALALTPAIAPLSAESNPALHRTANAVTLAPWGKGYLAGGGAMTFTATLNYSSTVTVPGLSLIAPPGWKFVSVGGVNPPTIAPRAGDEGEMNFTYVGAPAGLATFTVTLSYPAGLTGNQTFSSVYAVFRPDQAKAIQPNLVIGAIPQ